MLSRKPVTVTKKALLRRINRQLLIVGRANGGARKIKRGRGRDTGGFYVLDIARNEILAWGLDLEETGRRMGILTPGQVLAD